MKTSPEGYLIKTSKHTDIKLQILKEYLRAWFGILSNNNPNIIIVDGFSGSGRYEDGDPGSPIIELDIALQFYNTRKPEVYYLFIEEDKKRIQCLKNEIQKIETPQTFHIQAYNDKFENVLPRELDNLRTKFNLVGDIPTFVFIDPFGFSGLPYSIIKNLLNRPKTEVFITLMTSFINRFVNTNENIDKTIEDLFGTDQVLNLNTKFNDPNEIANLYRSQLLKCAKFVKHFAMYNNKNKVIYHLFFASNHELGYHKIKEVLWRVDRLNGTNFSDNSNPDQPVLFPDTPAKELSKNLLVKFEGQEIIYDKKLENYIAEKTIFITSQLKEALRLLEKDGKIEVKENKNDGSKRKRGSFTNGTIIRFT